MKVLFISLVIHLEKYIHIKAKSFNRFSLLEFEQKIEWPDLQICKTPKHKDAEKYVELMRKGTYGLFKDWKELDELSKEALNPNPNDIILKVAISKDYRKAIGSVNIPNEPPYVKTILFDYMYFGYCISISFEALRSYLVEIGEIKKDDLDSDFYALVWFQV